MKEKKNLKKLELKKETISNLDVLSRGEMKAAAGGYNPCWENLWTAYYCKVIWTGETPE